MLISISSFYTSCLPLKQEKACAVPKMATLCVGHVPRTKNLFQE